MLYMNGHPKWAKVEAVWNSATSLTITYAQGFAVYIEEDAYRALFTKIDIDYRLVDR